jgi:hypothetical protein
MNRFRNFLLQRLGFVHLTQGADKFCWNLTKNGKFLVHSKYRVIIKPPEPVVNNKMIWKMEIPLKTNVSAWHIHRGVILTKDNLTKHN